MRRSRLRLVLVILLIGTGVWWLWPRRENPTLAGIPLQERIRDFATQDERTQSRTLNTLAAFGPRAAGALPEIVSAIDNSRTTSAAVMALGRLREKSLPTLTAWLGDPKPKNLAEYEWKRRRQHAAEALGYAGPCAVPLLRQYLTDMDPGVFLEVRQSLTRIVGEHPSLLPALAADLKNFDADLKNFDLSDCRYFSLLSELRVAAEDPAVLALWKGLLDHPHPEIQRFAVRNLATFFPDDPEQHAKTLLDPRCILGLVQVVAPCFSLLCDPYDPSQSAGAPTYLARLHRAGHPVLPALMAELQRSLAVTPDHPVSGLIQELLWLGSAADPAVPEIVHLLNRRIARDDEPLVFFLTTYEKRLAARQNAVVAMVGGFGTALPTSPSVAPVLAARFGCVREPHGVFPNAVVLKWRTIPDRLTPHLAQEIRTGTVESRLEVLRAIIALYDYQRAQVPMPVSRELVRATADCLTDPNLKPLAIRCLGEFGSAAAPAMPDLLGILDEANFETILEATSRIFAIDPADGERFARLRAQPRSAELRALLAAKRTRSDLTAAIRPYIHFLLEPSSDAVANKLAPDVALYGVWRADDALCTAIAALDPLYETLMLDAGVLDQFRTIYRHPIDAPIVLRQLRQGRWWTADCLPNAVSPEVARALFDLLAADDPNGQRRFVEDALLRLTPLPGTWPVPEQLLTDRRAALVALRWNPTDARAKQAVVLGYPKHLFVPSAGYDPRVVRVLAPHADDPRVVRALFDLFHKFEQTKPDAESVEFDLLDRAICQTVAGRTGLTEQFLKLPPVHEPRPFTRKAMRRMVADGGVDAPAVLDAAIRAGQSTEVLFDLLTDRTLDRLMALLVNDPKPTPVEALYNNTTLRHPRMLPVLRKWLTDPKLGVRYYAFRVLRRTHPTDAEVWAAAESLCVEGYGFDRFSDVIELFRSDPARALPIVRTLATKRPEEASDRRRMYAYLFDVMPEADVKRFLTDTDPAARRAAIEKFRNPEVLGKALSDSDAQVRRIAWNRLWEQDKLPFDLLSAEQHRAWVAQTGIMLALENPNDLKLVRRIQAMLIPMDFNATPALRADWIALEKMLPPSEPVPESTSELLKKFLTQSTSDSVNYLRCRAELLRRAPGDPSIAAALYDNYFCGQRLLNCKSMPGYLHQLAPSIPLLIAGFDRFFNRLDALMNLLGDFGPSARDAVPHILPYTADPRRSHRTAAREAIRKIAPDVFAELE